MLHGGVPVPAEEGDGAALTRRVDAERKRDIADTALDDDLIVPHFTCLASRFYAPPPVSLVYRE
jgi:hypothetical protein